MANEGVQYIGGNLFYTVSKPTPDYCAIKVDPTKPLAKVAPMSAPGKAYGTPPLKPPKREREDDEDKEIVRCKRRLDFAKLGLPMHKQSPAVAARRNERERKRVKYINDCFDVLKTHLPQELQTPKAKSKELSKVEILRGAIDYIMTLEEMLTKSNINFESQFSALLQASDLTDDQLALPGTPGSHNSDALDALSSAASPAPSCFSQAPQTPSQHLQVNLVATTPSHPATPSVTHSNSSYQQRVPDLLPQSGMSSLTNTPSNAYSSIPATDSTATPTHHSKAQSYSGELFTTDFSSLQCATANAEPNNNNLIMASDLNANDISKNYNLTASNKHNDSQLQYTLNLDCNMVPDLSLIGSSGYDSPAPGLCSPAPPLMSQQVGFNYLEESNGGFADFASLLNL